MGEVEELCDRVAIIGHGRVLYEGALDELMASAAAHHDLKTTDDVQAAEIAREFGEVTDIAGGLRFTGEAAALSIALGQAGVGITALVPRTPTLEELFFQMTEGDR
jgi:ABC-2 type transport system ATP-binding protein